jgi:hypothetical protein
MNRMRALGVDWNRMDPFVRYTPYDFPVIENPYPYAFPVIQETPPVVVPTPASPAAAVPNWVLIGGSVLAGVALGALLLKK